MIPLVRCLQACTAGAALFAILGACGLTPLGAGRRPRPHPRPHRAEVLIRSLTGTWAAVQDTPDGAQPLLLSLVQSGDSLTGTLSIGGRTLVSDPAHPAFLGSRGEFTLGFGRSHERVVVAGRPSPRADRLSASIRRDDLPPVAAIFTRR
jgi:hypothetical protein